MMFDKETNNTRRLSKEAGVPKLQRPRPGKNARASSRAREFWRALSAVALSSPQTPSLRRLHD